MTTAMQGRKEDEADRVTHARELGRQAFLRGANSVPMQDPGFAAMIAPGSPVGSSISILTAWAEGWTAANLDEPWIDEDPAPCTNSAGHAWLTDGDYTYCRYCGIDLEEI